MMRFSNRLKASPLRLLLYLEWMLFAIGMLVEFGIVRNSSPLFLEFSPIFPQLSPIFFPVSIFCAIAFLILGLWQPRRGDKLNFVYIGLGFTLIGITAIASNASPRLFPPLLLIMMIRGCLSFNLIGSSIVAIISLISFFIFLSSGISEYVNKVDFQQILNIQSEVISQVSPAELSLKSIIIQMVVSNSTLFCLLSLFVFLLVNALKSEYFSQLELRQANHQLREYALLIEDRAMLQERNRIAREIHDSLGHSLTAQNLYIANALMYLRSNVGRTENFLLEAKQLTSNALQEVRHSVSTLRSDPLQGKQLAIAIAELVKDFEDRTEIAFNFKSIIVKTIPREITTAIYRIVQEALTNMLKHSEAEEVNIDLKETGQYIKLYVWDNGIGFDPQENTTGFGIQGMKERTTALGGEFELKSMPEKGCHIVVTIPWLRKL